MSVGGFVCLFVCLLEPLHFPWNYLNFDGMGFLLARYVLYLSGYVSDCLFVWLFVLGYVLYLSGYVSDCLFVWLFEVLAVGFHLLRIVCLFLF